MMNIITQWLLRAIQGLIHIFILFVNLDPKQSILLVLWLLGERRTLMF